MLRIDLDVDSRWHGKTDWQSLTLDAVTAAMNEHSFNSASLIAFDISVSILMASNDELRALNRDYRQKDRATNVLSFPMLGREELAAFHQNDYVTAHETLLGDIALAYETCAAEAAEKGISLPHHVTHLIIHGTLHLLGYDHIEEAEGDAMEALEVKALASLGLPNPYG